MVPSVFEHLNDYCYTPNTGSGGVAEHTVKTGRIDFG